MNKREHCQLRALHLPWLRELLVSILLARLREPPPLGPRRWHPSRDQQGSHQPPGFVKGISGVGVRVDIQLPHTNPYPSCGYHGSWVLIGLDSGGPEPQASTLSQLNAINDKQ